jgi:hypothetical protein
VRTTMALPCKKIVSSHETDARTSACNRTPRWAGHIEPVMVVRRSQNSGGVHRRYVNRTKTEVLRSWIDLKKIPD